MKDKFIIFLQQVIFLLIIAVSCTGAYPGRNVLCRYAGDGRPDWDKADSVTVTPTGGESDNEMVVKTIWTSDSLYFQFRVSDADLRAEQTENDHKKLYLDDMVEVLIDALDDKTSFWHEDDIVYHIDILGYKKDDRGTPDHRSDASWNGTARYSIWIRGTIGDSSDIDEGYVVEIAFPWTERRPEPHPGLKLGVNFANGDDDGLGRQLYNWCNSDPMRSPDTFGTLTLIQESVQRDSYCRSSR